VTNKFDHFRSLDFIIDRFFILGFCAADHSDISGMVNDAEDKLFHKILYDASHVLSMLLPERRYELTYSLRTRRHDRTLSQRVTRLAVNNFIILPYN